MYLWIAVLVLARPSQHNQGAEQRQQTKQNQQKKKETHQELVFQWAFFPSSSSSLRSSLNAHFMRNALTLQTKPLP